MLKRKEKGLSATLNLEKSSKFALLKSLKAPEWLHK